MLAVGKLQCSCSHVRCVSLGFSFASLVFGPRSMFTLCQCKLQVMATLACYGQFKSAWDEDPQYSMSSLLQTYPSSRVHHLEGVS